MGLPVLVCGESGSGKTTSLRNFKKSEALVFLVTKKLPKKVVDLNSVMVRGMSYSERYEVIKECILKYQSKVKVFAIDDSDSLMFFEQQQRNNEAGYKKYTEIALHMIDLINFVINDTDDDVIVYFLNHVDIDDSRLRAITAGKLIDKQLGTIESQFNEVIYCMIIDGEHKFMVRGDGTNTAKTPLGMYDIDIIDNDLKAVDTTIREYYDIGS